MITGAPLTKLYIAYCSLHGYVANEVGFLDWLSDICLGLTIYGVGINDDIKDEQVITTTNQ